MDHANIPAIRREAAMLINAHFDRGEFALSPPNIPSQIWAETARRIGRDEDVCVETRVDRKTDQAMVRMNRGFPRGIKPFSPEGKDWASEHPGWRADQRVWVDTMHLGC